MNMKKYAPKSEPSFHITLDSEKEIITFKNNKLVNPIKLGTKQGLNLSNELLSKMGMNPLIIDTNDDNQFVIKLILKNTKK